MLPKLIVIYVALTTLKGKMVSFQSNVMAPTKMQPFTKNPDIDMNSCMRKSGTMNTQINGQSIPMATFQSDANYYKKSSNPLECVEKVNQNFQKASVAASETFNKVLTSQAKNPEKNCMYTMDKKANNCFITKFLDQIVSHPMWNIVLHLNVIQIFFGTKLRKMIVFENFNYVIKNAVKNCVTRFKDATAVAKHNAFGSVLEFIGDLPKEQKLECTPCGMGKNNSKNANTSIEGQSDCSSCDPFTQLMGYQSHITEVTSGKQSKSKSENKKKNGQKKNNSATRPKNN